MCMCVYSAFGLECEFMILVKIIYALNKSILRMSSLND